MHISRSEIPRAYVAQAVVLGDGHVAEQQSIRTPPDSAETAEVIDDLGRECRRLENGHRIKHSIFRGRCIARLPRPPHISAALYI